MLKVQNNNEGAITLAHDNGNKVVLLHGINEDIPEWITEIKYAESLHDAGIISVLGRMPDAEEPLPDIEYELDGDGNKIQATGPDGELIFDEESGEPVYVPKVTE